MSEESGRIVFYVIMSFVFKRKEGDETINFIAFNYDGEGTSLAIVNENEFMVYPKKETKEIIEGPKGEVSHYDFNSYNK